ncbi:MAG: hypothetical protein V1742_10025 [Pseudomonadota bacterium]
MEEILVSRARETGVTKKELQKNLMDGIERDLQSARNEMAKMALAQIKKFLQKPGRLRVEIKPEKPMSLGSLWRYKTLSQAVQPLSMVITAD